MYFRGNGHTARAFVGDARVMNGKIPKKAPKNKADKELVVLLLNLVK